MGWGVNEIRCHRGTPEEGLTMDKKKQCSLHFSRRNEQEGGSLSGFVN